jgi:hypothetical protein
LIVNITVEMVLFGITLLGAISGVWWRVEAKIKDAEQTATLRALNAQAKAEAVSADFAKYQTHVAEVYVSKQGLREVRDEIMHALQQVRGDIGRINDRIDRFADRSEP